MSPRAQEFINQWIAINVSSPVYVPQGGLSESQLKAAVCQAEASKADISQKEIENAVGDLAEYIARIIRSETA